MRRRWIGGLVAAGCLAAACSSASDESVVSMDRVSTPAVTMQDSGASTPAVDAARSAAPTGPLDAVTWAITFPPLSLDPIRSWNFAENTVLGNLCESVLSMDADLVVRPGLASSFDVSDPMRVVLTVREGVHFWNGDTMRADDVAFSLRRNLDPAAGGYYSSLFTNVESVEVSGPNQVTIALRDPDSMFWKTLALAAGAVSQRSAVESAGLSYGTPDHGLMCTGPYRLAHWDAGGDVVMTANDDYWNEALPRLVRTVTVRTISDDVALLNALLTGEVDGTFLTPVGGVDSLVASGAGSFIGGPTTMVHALVPSLKGPFGDVRLRRALSLAIDRQLMADTVWEGHARPASSVVTPLTWGYEPEAFAAAADRLGVSPTADVDAARLLVDEYLAEYGSIEAVHVWAPAENAEMVTVANYIADVANDIGLPLDVRTMPITQYANWSYDDQFRSSRDLFQVAWWTDIADPIETLLPLADDGGDTNYFGYDNAVVRANLRQALAAPDDAARARLVIAAQQQMIGEDLVWIPMVEVENPVFLGKRVTGVPLGLPAYMFMPWAAMLGAP